MSYRSQMKKTLSAASLAVALLLCTGCSTIGGGANTNPPAGDNRPSTDTSETAPSDSAPTSTELGFGQSYSWDDGVSITVSKPATFKPGRYSVAKKAKAYRKFTITVVNKSQAAVNLNLTYITVQSDNTEAQQVFDAANGLEGAPATKLLKGRESKWHIGFGVSNPKDMVMEVSLQDDFERPSLIYST